VVFFCLGHGKRPHDGAGALVKWFVQREQLKSHGVKLQNVLEVVQFLYEHLFN
jgi:hypothetical protein